MPQPDSLRELVRLVAQRRHIEAGSILPLLASAPRGAELLLELINRGILEPEDRPR